MTHRRDLIAERLEQLRIPLSLTFAATVIAANVVSVLVTLAVAG